ncbi:hypothetical protein KKC45_00425 [Patescibacteria group bacterium]|nr:hypothetical protein [Patescibacteria group bacterium]
MNKGPKEQKIVQEIAFNDNEKIEVSPTADTKTKLNEGIEKAVRLLQSLEKHLPQSDQNLTPNERRLRDHIMVIENLVVELKSHLNKIENTSKNQKGKIEENLNKLNNLIHKSSHLSTYRKYLRIAKKRAMRDYYNGNIDDSENLVNMFTLLGKNNGGKTETRILEQERNGKDETIMKVEKIGDELLITKYGKNGEITETNYKFTIDDNGKWQPTQISFKEGAKHEKKLKTVEAKSETPSEKRIKELKTLLANLKEGGAELTLRVTNKKGERNKVTFAKIGGKIFYRLKNGELSAKPYDLNDTKTFETMKKQLASGTTFEINEQEPQQANNNAKMPKPRKKRENV